MRLVPPGGRTVMSGFVSRGFAGRGDREQYGDRLPGQYAERAVSTAGPADTDAWSFRVDGMVADEREWTWDEFHALRSRRCRRHPLRDQVVEARHLLAGVSVDRCSTASSRGGVRRRSSATAATRPTCRSRTSPAARPGSPSATTASRSSPSTAARRACSCRTSTSGRARSGCAGCAHGRGRAGLLGVERLPQLRRPVEEQRYWGD